MACLSQVQYQRIQERILRKFINQETNFLRTVEQLSELGKRTLTKLFTSAQLISVNRGHEFYRENDQVTACYIVKQGECEMIKSIYDNKYTKDEERQVLTSQSTQCQKFNSNFNKAQGVRPCGRVRVRTPVHSIHLLQIALLGPGKMFGEDEMIRGCRHLSTVTVNSLEAQVLRIRKEVALKVNIFRIFLSLKSFTWSHGS